MNIKQHQGMEVYDSRGSVVDCVGCDYRTEPQAKLSDAWSQHHDHYQAVMLGS